MSDTTKILAKCVREYKGAAIATPLLMMGEVAMEVAIPALMAKVIDRGVMRSDMSFLLKISAVLILSAMLSLLFGWLGGVTAAKASTGFAKNIRRDLFHRLQDFSFRTIDSFSQSSLITRMTGDVQNVQNAFQMTIRLCFRAPLMLIFALLMVVRSGGSLSLVFAVCIPLLAIGLLALMREVYPRMTAAFRSYDKLNNVVRENITGIRAVKAYVREEEEKKRFAEANELIHDNYVAGEKILALTRPLMMGAAYACVLLLSWLGAHAIVSDRMSTGELMSVLTYTMQILSSLMMISMIVVMLSIARASAERIAEVLTAKTDMEMKEGGRKTLDDGSVVFDHVSFSYATGDGALCLKDISCAFKSGETIGILGNTGSGKSTLVSLIPRLYDVTKGRVLVGGADVRDYDIHALRRGVSMVLQKNQLFRGTIAENIRWGREEATDDEVREACAIASADEFISPMKDGYESLVEQGGANFSGGQKQRLCIARAIIGKPKILILDDSTSAVDTGTDRKIRDALKRFSTGTTKIIISQRIQSVRDADLILILSDGAIVDRGTHEELLSRSRMYQSLYATQNKVADNG